jgi:Uma2 family endonuclease
LREHPVGRAIPEAGYILAREPLTIRQPDVSVLSEARIQGTEEDSYFEGAPELAVEVVWPSDSAEDLEVMVKQYLNAGAEQVWVLYPKTRDVWRW